MPILNVHAGSLPSFALRMKSEDTLAGIKSRCAKKIRLDLGDGIPLIVRYRWQQQLYTLEDGEQAQWTLCRDADCCLPLRYQMTTGRSSVIDSSRSRKLIVSDLRTEAEDGSGALVKASRFDLTPILADQTSLPRIARDPLGWFSCRRILG